MSFVTNKPRNIHELKILPEYFSAVADRKKTFEVRKSDRDFKCDDIVILKEFDAEKGYTGNEAITQITYILNDENYCKQGYIIFSFEILRVQMKSFEKCMLYMDINEAIDNAE